jgi:hypothetical protein
MNSSHLYLLSASVKTDLVVLATRTTIATTITRHLITRLSESVMRNANFNGKCYWTALAQSVKKTLTQMRTTRTTLFRVSTLIVPQTETTTEISNLNT